ncbi:MAG: PEP/pyruvate-binding domain-containing protein, partial [Pseudomonadota bacterium]
MDILELGEASRAGTEEIGGKAANLNNLIRLGLTVPKGIVVAAAAYEAHAVRCNLEGRLAPFIERRDWRGAELMARRCLVSNMVDEELAERIVDRFRSMRSSTVAVRSSATCEDQESASFAGQYETFLNVQ